MTDPAAPRDRHDFKLAILCTLPVEAESVRAIFDRCWEDDGQRYGKATSDKNIYTTGLIGRYNVVLVLLPSTGGVPATQTAASLSSSFPKIEVVFIVGICGVVPFHPDTGEEIILGDVIVSTAVTHYDYGRKSHTGGFERKGAIQDSLRKAPREIQGFISKLALRQNRQKIRTDIGHLVNSRKFKRSEPTAVYPGATQDHLYEPSYLHQHQPKCDACHGGLNTTCARDCDQLGCEQDKLVRRVRHEFTQQDNVPQVHFGRFGSANVMMKSGVARDELAHPEGLVAIEMSGARVWDDHPTIVIKGACDYADSHKTKRWQPYAAMMAAACLKVVLVEWMAADELADRSQSLPVRTTRAAELSALHEDHRGFSSGGGIQTNNVNSHIAQQINNNAPVGEQYLGPGKSRPF